MARDKLTLDFLEPPQREYLRKEAEKGGCTPAEVLRRMVECQMRSSDEQEAGRERIMRLAGMISDNKVSRDEDPLDQIVGMIEGDGEVTGENFHDYLYGWGSDRQTAPPCEQ